MTFHFFWRLTLNLLCLSILLLSAHEVCVLGIRSLLTKTSQDHLYCAALLPLCPILCDAMDCSPRLLCPWDSPGKNTGVGCHALLQEIFPTQGSNPRIFCLTCISRQILHHWEPGPLGQQLDSRCWKVLSHLQLKSTPESLWKMPYAYPGQVISFTGFHFSDIKCIRSCPLFETTNMRHQSLSHCGRVVGTQKYMLS